MLCASQAHADSARELVARGNAAYEAGRYADALADYERAATASPESPQIEFNRGTALYRQGDFENAIEAFDQAARKRPAPMLAARSQFNHGNSLFRQAERQSERDLAGAVASCEESILHFREAFALDAKLKEAAENIEIARLYLHSLREKVRQQEDAKKDETDQDQKQSGRSEENSNESNGSDGEGNSQPQSGSSRGNRPSMSNQGQGMSGGQGFSPAQSPMEGLRRQLQQQQQQFRQQIRGQIQQMSQLPGQSQWNQQHSFSFQFGGMPGFNHSSQSSPPREPVSNEPRDIMAEERENLSNRQNASAQASEPSVDKDW